MLESRWCIFTAHDTPSSCILVLPGRGQTGHAIARAWADINFAHTMVIAVTPKLRRWYPQPYNATHQEEALAGISLARQTIEEVVSKIETEYRIPRRQIALVGFSAGGVMGIDVAAHSEKEFAAVVCHSGAILDPSELPPCRFNMPIVLTHCKDDLVFAWEERFLPMEDALLRENYQIVRLISEHGGHGMSMDDILNSAKIISYRLDYEEDLVDEGYYDL